jgi:hypothetical protein
METSIQKLLEMLDNPGAYTEQEIHDIINHDEDTRETYRVMVEAKRCSNHRKADKPVDVDAAWHKLNVKRQSEQHGWGWMRMAASSTFGRASSRREEQMRASLSSRLVASFIGVLLVSGIAFAAIQMVRNAQQHAPKTEEMVSAPKSANIAPTDTLTTDTIAALQPVIYDNMPLEKLLSDIAAHYDAKVAFANDDVRQLRFHFVWNPLKGIDQVVSDLNQFERLTVTLKDNQITVK